MSNESKTTEKYIICLKCRGVFSEEETKSKWGCPTCGHQGVPGDTREKHSIILTDHEWRVLCMWADQWAHKCDKDAENDNATSSINGILKEMKKQQPDLPALTLREEIQHVSTALGNDVELHQGDNKEVFNPERKH